MSLAAWLPPDMAPAIALLLIATSLLTSALSAALGLGGGVTLIAVMAQVLPVAALVPVHGVVQLGSNAGRALVLRRHVNWPAALWFALGGLAGALLGGSIAITLPAPVLRIGLGLFILWMIWGHGPRLGHMPKRAMAAAGFVATALSMFFGAAGPIGGAVLSALGLTRHGFVATQAMTALMMHVLKIAVFGLLGFAFAPWAGLIVLMIGAGFIGTLLGTRLLGRIPERSFRIGFRLLMTGLAGSLVWRGAMALAAGG